MDKVSMETLQAIEKKLHFRNEDILTIHAFDFGLATSQEFGPTHPRRFQV